VIRLPGEARCPANFRWLRVASCDWGCGRGGAGGAGCSKGAGAIFLAWAGKMGRGLGPGEPRGRVDGSAGKFMPGKKSGEENPRENGAVSMYWGLTIAVLGEEPPLAVELAERGDPFPADRYDLEVCGGASCATIVVVSC